MTACPPEKPHLPGLGDLPLIGGLFRRTVKSTVKTELLIFLTPRVAERPEHLEGISKDQTSSMKAVKEAGGPGAFEEHMKAMRQGEQGDTPEDQDEQLDEDADEDQR